MPDGSTRPELRWRAKRPALRRATSRTCKPLSDLNPRVRSLDRGDLVDTMGALGVAEREHEPPGPQQRDVVMSEATQFTIGAEVTCADGVCGEIRQVVVDPVAKMVTHLVVEPKHRSGLGRLVPLDLIDSMTDDIRLRCTMAEFENLDHAEETQFLPGGSGAYGGYAAGQTFLWPYYGLAGGMLGNSLGGGVGIGNAPLPVVHDTLPMGEVAVQRGDQVHASDGDIGQVQGLVIDPSTHHVSHVLLQEGHFWGRKEVAIPISAVAGVDEKGITLNISKDDVADLPPVDLDHLDSLTKE